MESNLVAFVENAGFGADHDASSTALLVYIYLHSAAVTGHIGKGGNCSQRNISARYFQHQQHSTLFITYNFGVLVSAVYRNTKIRNGNKTTLGIVSISLFP